MLRYVLRTCILSVSLLHLPTLAMAQLDNPLEAIFQKNLSEDEVEDFIEILEELMDDQAMNEQDAELKKTLGELKDHFVNKGNMSDLPSNLEAFLRSKFEHLLKIIDVP